jgi:hypothetical protein
MVSRCNEAVGVVASTDNNGARFVTQGNRLRIRMMKVNAAIEIDFCEMMRRCVASWQAAVLVARRNLD